MLGEHLVSQDSGHVERKYKNHEKKQNNARTRSFKLGFHLKPTKILSQKSYEYLFQSHCKLLHFNSSQNTVKTPLRIISQFCMA